MKTKIYNDRLGYNPKTKPLKTNTRYVVSEETKIFSSNKNNLVIVKSYFKK